MEMPEDVATQTANALRTIEGALQQAGFAMSDVVRATYYLTDVAYADTIIPILGKTFGEIRPAASIVIAQLLKPEMKVEIEVTACKWPA
jgi:enamine deaminase RidA (YjgF/YER057c/UK114 family)